MRSLILAIFIASAGCGENSETNQYVDYKSYDNKIFFDPMTATEYTLGGLTNYSTPSDELACTNVTNSDQNDIYSQTDGLGTGTWVPVTIASSFAHRAIAALIGDLIQDPIWACQQVGGQAIAVGGNALRQTDSNNCLQYWDNSTTIERSYPFYCSRDCSATANACRNNH